MADLVPALVGTVGLVNGECYALPDGTDIVVGRSRSCDISLRRSAGYLKSPADTRDSDHAFNTVSRRHLRLQVHDTVIRLQDLSTNGTYFNDELVEQAREVDLATGPATVRLGTRETFQMIMLPKDDPRIAAPTQPPGGTLPEPATNGKTDPPEA